MAIPVMAFILFSSFPAFAMETDRLLEEASPSEPAQEYGTDFPIPEEAPAFHAHIEYRMGYTVIGTFTDFTPDITLIETLYSPDGENWRTGPGNWNLFISDTDNEDLLTGLQNQPCLLSAHEPLKSYIAGDIDRFYLKLRITKKSGLSYESRSAVIERGGLQPIPEGTDCRARFSSEIAVRESLPAFPRRYRQYGRYQIAIPEGASAEEISALLPDTLPVEIQLDRGADFIAIGVIDCPVTWKPLSLPLLAAGESITIPDAAEEILVPGGTQVSTPLGIFQLKEPLSLNMQPSTDEVRLVLNVSPKDGNPTGVLKEDGDGLKISLHQKPTGAVSVQAYALTEGGEKWTELPGLSLLKELNSQLSTENSGYGLVLRKDQEPYRSYLAAAAAGETPTAFFVCLKFEGGLYDGKELILSWPDLYDELPDLPKIIAAEGNEGNAGAANSDNSTGGGQRPNLPQTPEITPILPENRNASSADGSVPDTNRSIPEQRQNPSPAAPETAHSSTGNQENSKASTVPAAPDTNLSAGKAAIAHTPENSVRTSPVPVAMATATAITAGGCIGGAAFRKVSGHRLFCRIAGKIRAMLHK